MKELELVGKIVKDEIARYRIIHYAQDVFVLCQLDVTQLNLQYYSAQILQRKLRNKCIKIEDDANQKIMNLENLSEKHRISLEKRKEIIAAVSQAFGPSYMKLMGKERKEDFCTIYKRFNISPKTLWKYIRNYLQSGFNDTSLLDHRISYLNDRNKKYHYQKKPGRRWPNTTVKGIALTPEVLEQFSTALEEYKSGREKTVYDAYIGLLISHYRKENSQDHSYSYLPESERPSYRQLLYYFKKNLTAAERRIIKTSLSEERNDNRLITGTSSTRAIRPGWIVEVDALELDCSIVSEYNASQCVGRPILYMMIDCYSRAIVAFSLSFNNNSVIGLTNLLLNLMEDKKELCNKYGFIASDFSAWPSNFIPQEMRCDRGADFKSDQFSEICQRLGINRSLVSGGSGSLKGLIERSFGQLQAQLRPDLEGKGLITKRHDSKHHKQAILNISDFMKLVISFVFAHNMKSLSNYPLTKDMRLNLDCQPSPSWLWNYGCQKFGIPNIIQPGQKNQYVFDLMREQTATLSRKGLCFKGLYYHISHDASLAQRASELLNKRESFTIRIDPRYVGAVYYINNGVLHKAVLNIELSGDASFANMTLAELEEFHRENLERKKVSATFNLEIDASHYAIRHQIIESKETPKFTDTKNMREARAIEKNATNLKNKLESHMEYPECLPEKENDSIPFENKQAHLEHPKDIYEAIDRFNEFEEEDFDDI